MRRRRDLLLAAKGNLPTLYAIPSAFRSSSLLPTHATWRRRSREEEQGGWVEQEQEQGGGEVQGPG